MRVPRVTCFGPWKRTQSFNQVARRNLELLRNLQDIQESSETGDLPEALKDLPEALIPSQ